MIAKYFKNKLYRLFYSLSVNEQAELFTKLKDNWQKSIYNSYRAKYDIDETFRFNGSDIIFYGDGQIKCDRNSYIGSNSTIQCVNGKRVLIGKHCSISHNVRMYTSSREADQSFIDNSQIKYKEGNIIIEDGVWIGANVFINPGITIKTNSIVGANSVLTKDVEAGSIVGGVPAKFLRYKKVGNEPANI